MSKLEKKIKVLTISDSPFAPSGVGLQTKFIIEGLLNSGEFQVVSLAGAIKHKSYQPIKTEEYGDDWFIFPVDKFGNPDIVRSVIRQHRPDILWFMTDPRFYGWLWEMEDEIRGMVPMIYYHVWDNYPIPNFNEKFYRSNDKIVAISRLTEDIVKTVAPSVECEYLPHAVNPEYFKKYSEVEVQKFRQKNFPGAEDKFFFFFNSRNARRKQTGSLLFWYKSFLDDVGHDKACLVMHTDPKDPNGQDLHYIVENLSLDKGQVKLSTGKLNFPELALLYNNADCTILLSDAEGFGIAINESLACGTPVICTKTGGMQDQALAEDGTEFGVVLEPVSKAVIGSQNVPFIYEDRLSEEQVVGAMKKMFEMSKEERENIGARAIEHVQTNFNFKKYQESWIHILKEFHEKNGSWSGRKGYSNYRMVTL